MKAGISILAVIFACGCAKPVFKSKWVKETSPDKFTARFETSKGRFDVEFERILSPYAVDRIYQLIKHRFYDNTIFYRADSGFVVQFGTGDSIKSSHWNKYKIPDEPVVYGNKKGSISFAREGKDTRGTELFINLQNNKFLDTILLSGVKGFPAFGNVIRYYEIVESVYTGYGDSTMKDLSLLYSNRAKFLGKFPRLDSIKKAYILK